MTYSALVKKAGGSIRNRLVPDASFHLRPSLPVFRPASALACPPAAPTTELWELELGLEVPFRCYAFSCLSHPVHAPCLSVSPSVTSPSPVFYVANPLFKCHLLLSCPSSPRAELTSLFCELRDTAFLCPVWHLHRQCHHLWAGNTFSPLLHGFVQYPAHKKHSRNVCQRRNTNVCWLKGKQCNINTTI